MLTGWLPKKHQKKSFVTYSLSNLVFLCVSFNNSKCLPNYDLNSSPTCGVDKIKAPSLWQTRVTRLLSERSIYLKSWATLRRQRRALARSSSTFIPSPAKSSNSRMPENMACMARFKKRSNKEKMPSHNGYRLKSKTKGRLQTLSRIQ